MGPPDRDPVYMTPQHMDETTFRHWYMLRDNDTHPFVETVYGDEVTISREVAPDETDVDLTSELRESILLALPNNPVCSDDCRPPRPLAEDAGEADDGAASPWSALDALSGGTTHEQPAPPDPQKKPRTRKPKSRRS